MAGFALCDYEKFYLTVCAEPSEPRKLAALNITNALTGIHNRRHFDQELENEHNRAVRNQRPLALCILDMDHFKLYNDPYGHQGGDACLAKVLSQTVNRTGDTVTRHGGEEFVLQPPENSSQGALAVAQKILENVKVTALPHENSGFGVVSVSTGVPA
jgi:diguanylate cyclase (GGDEF)-like protein